MFELILESSSIPDIYPVYTSLLISFAIVYLFVYQQNISVVNAGSQIVNDYLKPNYLPSLINQERLVNPIMMWFFKAAKKYEFSDEDADSSISTPFKK
jgi:hypothetical protein